MAGEVKTRILAHYTRDDQNRFIQELVDAIRKHRADQLNQVKIALDANKKTLDDLQGHADALELILDGTLGRLKLG